MDGDSLDKKEQSSITSNSSTQPQPESTSNNILGISLKNLNIGQYLIYLLLVFYRLNYPAKSTPNELLIQPSIVNNLNGVFELDGIPPLIPLIYTLWCNLLGLVPIIDNNDFILPNSSLLRYLNILIGLLKLPLMNELLSQLNINELIKFGISLLVCFDNGLILESRYLFINNFSTILSCFLILNWYKLNNINNDEIDSRQYYNPIKSIGLGLGLSIVTSNHFIMDILTNLTFGLIYSYKVLGDRNIKVNKGLKILRNQFLLLTFIPIAIYFSIYQLLFIVQSDYNLKSGHKATIELQSTLNNNPWQHGIPKNLYYGSIVKIHHSQSPTGYISSSFNAYAGGSKQQIMTLRQDDHPTFSLFVIEPGFNRDRNYTLNPVYPKNYTVKLSKGLDGKILPIRSILPFNIVKHGDAIRLKHLSSGKFLHSHSVRPMFSNQDFKNEVSGYGFQGFEGDENDNFEIQLLSNIDKTDELERKDKPSIVSFQSKFRLKHILTSSKLYSRETLLPSWSNDMKLNEKYKGENHFELFCIQSGPLFRQSFEIVYNLPPLGCDENNENCINIDSDLTTKPIPSNFFQKVIEASKFRWFSIVKNDGYESNFLQWITLSKGVLFFEELVYLPKKYLSIIYLMVNPINLLFSLLSLISFGIVYIFVDITKRRMKSSYSNIIRDQDLVLKCELLQNYLNITFPLILAYLLHSLPYTLIDSPNTLVNYLTSHFILILTLAPLIQLIYNNLSKPNYKLSMLSLLVIGSMLGFNKVYKLTYGLKIKDDLSCSKLNLRSSWSLKCSTLRNSKTVVEKIEIVYAEEPDLSKIKVVAHYEKDDKLNIKEDQIKKDDDNNIKDQPKQQIINDIDNKDESNKDQQLISNQDESNQPILDEDGYEIVEEEVVVTVLVDENGKEIQDKPQTQEVVFVDGSGNITDEKEHIVYVDEDGSPIPKEDKIVNIVVEEKKIIYFGPEGKELKEGIDYTLDKDNNPVYKKRETVIVTEHDKLVTQTFIQTIIETEIKSVTPFGPVAAVIEKEYLTLVHFNETKTVELYVPFNTETKTKTIYHNGEVVTEKLEVVQELDKTDAKSQE